MSREVLCSVRMAARPMCGIPVHVTEPAPRCVFHAPFDAKTRDEFLSALRSVYALKVGSIFDQSAAYHGDKTVTEYDFTGFVCPTFAMPSRIEVPVYLDHAVFTSAVDLSDHIFTSTFSAVGARFVSDVTFARVMFQGGAQFKNAEFGGRVEFTGASFDQESSFAGATFGGDANFTFASFASNEDAAPATLDFRGIKCTNETKVLLHDVNRAASKGLQVRVRGSTINDLLLQRIHWRRERDRLVLEDEVDARRRPYGMDFVAAIDSYRRLIKYFDAEGEFELAEDCYWGLMELRRLEPADSSNKEIDVGAKEPGVAYRIGTTLSIINIYRVASSYGSSYRRALGILMGMLLCFAVAYALPSTGLVRIGAPATPVGLSDALHHAVEVATFVRSPMFDTSGRIGSLVELTQTLIVPAQAALFLLALRRRFAR